MEKFESGTKIKSVHNLALLMLEAIPQKVVLSFITFFYFLFHFMLDPDPNPDPECIAVSIALRQKVAVLAVAVPRHCWCSIVMNY